MTQPNGMTAAELMERTPYALTYNDVILMPGHIDFGQPTLIVYPAYPRHPACTATSFQPDGYCL